MANFPQHLRYGMISSAIASLVAYSKFGFNYVQSGAAFILGTLAGLAPDLDHPKSVPGEILFTAVGIVCPIAIALHYYPNAQFHLEHWLVIITIGYFLIKYVGSFLLDKITTHRGMFHSIPAAVICAELTFILFAHLAMQTRIVIAAIATIGYLTHLIADELYSVDWQGMSLKKSAGTALSFGKWNQLATWVAYAIAFSLGYLIWERNFQ